MIRWLKEQWRFLRESAFELNERRCPLCGETSMSYPETRHDPTCPNLKASR